MNKRKDLSNYLIHFTKGKDHSDIEGAFNNLKSILTSQIIMSSAESLRGTDACVCFTEAPIDCIKESGRIVCYNEEEKYSNFGIMVSKIDIYNRGGRPAVYTDPDHFDLLPENMKFRFVRFEPLKELRTGDGVIDFTWEREWRMLGDLDLRTLNHKIIVPSNEMGNELKRMAELESFQIFEECDNSGIPIVSYEEISNDVCEVHTQDCPQPIFIEEGCIVCMDNSC